MLRIRPMEVDSAWEYRVEYRPYDPRLAIAYELVRRIIRRAAGPVRVEHFGSSSIPGLGGRNVLDIAVVSELAHHTSVTTQLLEVGLQRAPFPHYLPVLVGQLVCRQLTVPMLIYVVSPSSSALSDWLTFRDYMRRHPDDVERYAGAKRAAITSGRSAGDEYQRAKDPVLELLKEKISGASVVPGG